MLVEGTAALRTARPDGTEPEFLLHDVTHVRLNPSPNCIGRRVRTYFFISYVLLEIPMPSKKKLTLSVDERVIERARRYSTRHNTSISQLVTSYLSQLDAPSETNLAPWVQRLRGILPSNISVEDYRRHVEEKHS